MHVVTGRPARRSGWGLLRRVWPVGVLLAAGLVVLASPGLQALLTVLIWASWLLIAFCAATASPRVRQLGVQLLARWRRQDKAPGVVRVQARRLWTRVHGELPAGERS